MSNELPPLPEFAHAFRPRWPGDPGGFCEAQMHAYAKQYAAQEVAAERELWREVLEERGRIHGESSRIYARLAGAVRAGADEAALAAMLREEVRNRGSE